MRVQGSSSTALATSSAAPRRNASGTFALPEQETRPQGSIASLRTIGGIDALVALQGLEDPTDRRRRAVRSGKGALDVLDALKLGLIGGDVEPATLNRLKVAAAELKTDSGDATLDAVIAEIALRVEVEIAKLTPR
jgi:hypothetical protein